jgi:hypothetical protein
MQHGVLHGPGADDGGAKIVTEWLVCDMDDGVLRREAARKNAVNWFMRFSAAKDVIERHAYGPGSYEYRVGDLRDPDDSCSAFIVREDRAAGKWGWDADQVPLYPLAGDLAYERVERPAQDSLDKGGLEGSDAVVLALPVRTEEDVAREDELVRELRKAHVDQERATAELAAARQRRREAAAGLRNLGKSMSWIAGKIGVTQQAVDGFLKYKERKSRGG